MLKINKTSLLLVLIICLFGCTGLNKQQTSIPTKDDGITNKYWKLKTLNGQPVKMTKEQAREQFFTLRNDGTLTGFAGCNPFTGNYKILKGNKIIIEDNLAVAMKYCADSGIKENEFLQVFKEANQYTQLGDRLILRKEKGKDLAVFEAVYF